METQFGFNQSPRPAAKQLAISQEFKFARGHGPKVVHLEMMMVQQKGKLESLRPAASLCLTPSHNSLPQTWVQLCDNYDAVPTVPNQLVPCIFPSSFCFFPLPILFLYLSPVRTAAAHISFSLFATFPTEQTTIESPKFPPTLSYIVPFYSPRSWPCALTTG